MEILGVTLIMIPLIIMNNNKFNNKKIIKENHCLNKILFRKLRKIKNKLWLLKEIMLLKSMVWKVN